MLISFKIALIFAVFFYFYYFYILSLIFDSAFFLIIAQSSTSKLEKAPFNALETRHTDEIKFRIGHLYLRVSQL